MAVAEFHLNAQNRLEKMKSFMAILPEGKTGPFPVFYLLHGLSDDHTAWTRLSSIERYVAGLPLIVIMPDGERGFYTDSKSDPKAAFESNIVHDLVPFVDATFQTRPDPKSRVVAGLSMGGYGAVKLALKHPELFSAAASHSGALAKAHRPLSNTDDWQAQWIPLFGEHPEGGPEDLFALSQRIQKKKRPALRIDCGTEDFLIQDNRDFHAHLENIGYAHQYQEHPGSHEWGYWDQHIQDTLAFFKKHLAL